MIIKGFRMGPLLKATGHEILNDNLLGLAAQAAYNAFFSIFPFFLFLAGVSLSLSLARRRAQGETKAFLMRHLLRRSLLLVALGLALNLVASAAFGMAHWRFPGVLQRIGVCVLAAGGIRVPPCHRCSARGVDLAADHDVCAAAREDAPRR